MEKLAMNNKTPRGLCPIGYKPRVISDNDIIAIDLNYMQQLLLEELPLFCGKNILITGGGGFIGYYLILCFLNYKKRSPREESINITILDNFICGEPTWLKHISEKITIIRHDISQPLPIFRQSFDYIFHAASIASPSYYRQNPLATIDANVTGFRQLLDYCLQQKKHYPLSGMLLFSSSEIYGDAEQQAIPTAESYPGKVSSTGPRACYDEAKRFCETLAVIYAQQFQLPIKIVRPFNNYGPGLNINDKRVIADFSKNILNNEDIVLYSDGSPTRSFCYISDAIIAYIKTLIHGRTGEAYNIGNPSPEISIQQLAENMISIARNLFNYQGTLRYQIAADPAYLTDNPQRRCPDVNKAKQHFSFSANIDLITGLERTLKWYYFDNSLHYQKRANA